MVLPDVERELLLARIAQYERDFGTGKVSLGSFVEEVRWLSEALSTNLAPILSPANFSAFGGLRTAEPYTLFDGKTLLDANSREWDDAAVSGSGTSSTFSANRASNTLAVSASTAGRRVRQTFRRFPYIPGKSQLSLVTFVHGAPVTGINRKIGVFDDRNGVFLYSEGTAVGFTRRTYTSGVAVDTKVLQSAWNLDPMDGTGPSGITLDLTKTQILVTDYEWLGVGRVRIGFDIDGQTYYCHQFLNANNLDAVYMSSPNLPIRYEIENTGAGGAANLEAICSTVISEGGQDPVGKSFAVVSSGIVTGINGTGSTRYALIGVRIAAVNASFATVQPIEVSMIGTTANDAFAWELVLDATIAGSPTFSAVTGSVAEAFIGTASNTVTGGTVLASGVATSQTQVTINPRNIQGPGVSRAGTPQTFSIVIRPFTNMSAVVALNWVER